jgi:hypothetical protein
MMIKLTTWTKQVATRGAALYRENPMLMGLALIHLALIPLELLVMAFDPRLLGGESVWLKPLRFDASIALYLVTLAIVLRWVSAPTREYYAMRISIAMIVETLCIGLQAARGVRSHFNVGTPLDGIAFQFMGLAIAYNTYLLVRLLTVFLRGRQTHLPDLMRRAVALGISATLLGSLIGGMMIGRMSHTGLHGGDLRLGHFLGLHGLQLMLVLGAWLSKSELSLPLRRLVLGGAFVLHLMVTLVVAIGA